MTHTLSRLAGLATMLAALTLAPPALAVGSPAHAPGAAKAKQYAKHCGSQTTRGRADGCTKAMKKLATGKSSSPRSACAGLSRKRVKGKGKSAFARCVTAGSKLMKQLKHAGVPADKQAGDSADDGSLDEDADPLDDLPLDGGLDDDGDDLDPADEPGT